VPVAGRVASGLACNPTFLTLWHGGPVLRAARLSRDFFGLGPFRATSMERAGGRVVLDEEVAASYYQPLEAARRRADGSYQLEHEGRFAASMAFSQRGEDVVRLRTTVAIDVDLDEVAVELTVTTRGPAAPHMLELALPPGAGLRGAEDLGGDRHLLTDEPVEVVVAGLTYRVDLEPGGATVAPPLYRPGEAYEFLGGTDALGGPRLYLTWSSPGTAAVRIRLA
jgi:hypothetical protein